MSNYEIQIMNKPGRTIQKTIVEAYQYDSNVFVHNEKAKIINRKYYIRDIWLNMLRNFLDRDFEYLVMLQDDVILGHNFKPAIKYILDEGLNVELLNLFNNYSIFRTYELGFIESKFQKAHLEMFRGQGHIVTRMCAKALIRKDMIDKFNIRHSDGYTVFVLNELKIPYAYTNPAFIDHDKTMKSTILSPGSSRPHSFQSSKTFMKNFDLLAFVKEFYI